MTKREADFVLRVVLVSCGYGESVSWCQKYHNCNGYLHLKCLVDSEVSCRHRPYSDVIPNNIRLCSLEGHGGAEPHPFHLEARSSTGVILKTDLPQWDAL